MAAAPPGGFIPPHALPSPAPSNASSASAHRLPQPQVSALRPGSRPENNLRQYLDTQLLQVSRKYTKKFMEGGYTSIKAVASDLEKLVDIVWISASPTLQAPYLLQIADRFNDYLASFPPQWVPTYWLLDKLDRCFYMLVTGSPVDEDTPLSPASQFYRLNMTHKVRLRSIIERTRLHVVKLAEAGEAVDAPDPPTESAGDYGDIREREVDRELEEDEMGSDEDEDEGEDEDEALEIEVARIYERTLGEIGEELRVDDKSNIGIPYALS